MGFVVSALLCLHLAPSHQAPIHRDFRQALSTLSPPARPAALRVVMLGDSLAFHALESDQETSRRLSALLARPVQFVSLILAGHYLVDFAPIFPALSAQEPHLILVQDALLAELPQRWLWHTRELLLRAVSRWEVQHYRQLRDVPCSGQPAPALEGNAAWLRERHLSPRTHALQQLAAGMTLPSTRLSLFSLPRSPVMRARLREPLTHFAEQLRTSGQDRFALRTVDAPLVDADYCDFSHVNASGREKLAPAFARTVADLLQDLP